MPNQPLTVWLYCIGWLYSQSHYFYLYPKHISIDVTWQVKQLRLLQLLHDYGTAPIHRSTNCWSNPPTLTQLFHLGYQLISNPKRVIHGWSQNIMSSDLTATPSTLQDLLFFSYLIHLHLDVFKNYQAGWDTYSLQRILVLPLKSPCMLIRCLKHLNWLLTKQSGSSSTAFFGWLHLQTLTHDQKACDRRWKGRKYHLGYCELNFLSTTTVWYNELSRSTSSERWRSSWNHSLAVPRQWKWKTERQGAASAKVNTRWEHS